ncbi:MAG: galactokinase [Pyrinomonadaceae bacterium]
MAVDFQSLKTEFVRFYNREPRLFRAPGRVNLIGEHTDYNGGFVLPMAIDCEAVVAVSTRDNRQIRVQSINLGESGEFDLDIENERKKGFWLNYIEGMARILERRNVQIKGADVLIWSDVPSGAGLSSSAALEMAVGLALSEISGERIDRKMLALAGQQTEHEFVGANVGIMDQFVSANARKGCALLLDCRSLEFENVPLNTERVAVVICNTNVKHDIATSEYNTRRNECEQGVEILRQFLPDIKQLRDVSVDDFKKFADKLPELIRRRCSHVVTEIARTLEAAAALKQNDLESFGRLMWQSHASLKDDYEVSCRELDLMVEIARASEGVLGARMTGGGFGGSTVNLVRRQNLEKFKERISREYQSQTDIEPDIFVTEPSEGASEIK